MHYKRRRGNLLVTVLVFIMLTMTITAMFSINVSMKQNARTKANQAGDSHAYIALANLCADAFKDDLEAQVVRIVTADVENPDGTGEEDAEDIGLEVYNEALAEIQASLTRETVDDNTWLHHLTDPHDPLAYIGFTGEEEGLQSAAELAARLLEDAVVEIKVTSGDLTASGGLEGESGNLTTGDNIGIDNIYYTVTLTKGTWKVVQNYCLQGERLTGRIEPSLIWIAADGTDAVNQMIGQSVSKRNFG